MVIIYSTPKSLHSKIEKKMEHWKHTKVSVDEIESVLTNFIPETWSFHNTYFKITHPSLVNHSHCNYHGDFFINLYHSEVDFKEIIYLVEIIEHIRNKRLVGQGLPL
ncbi:MAG: hypothetical protein HYZ54_06020 [Ignavibacteriae bacterium]|nr:hypothetical protein [Ignavibacteriota bacterium]